MINRIVTRGMSVSTKNSLVTRGFIPFLQPIVEAAEAVVRVVKRGQSAAKRELERVREIIVRAELVEVNKHELAFPLQGFLRITFNATMDVIVSVTGRISSAVKRISENIVITARRIIR